MFALLTIYLAYIWDRRLFIRTTSARRKSFTEWVKGIEIKVVIRFRYFKFNSSYFASWKNLLAFVRTESFWLNGVWCTLWAVFSPWKWRGKCKLPWSRTTERRFIREVRKIGPSPHMKMASFISGITVVCCFSMGTNGKLCPCQTVPSCALCVKLRTIDCTSVAKMNSATFQAE